MQTHFVLKLGMVIGLFCTTHIAIPAPQLSSAFHLLQASVTSSACILAEDMKGYVKELSPEEANLLKQHIEQEIETLRTKFSYRFSPWQKTLVYTDMVVYAYFMGKSLWDINKIWSKYKNPVSSHMPLSFSRVFNQTIYLVGNILGFVLNYSLAKLIKNRIAEQTLADQKIEFLQSLRSAINDQIGHEAGRAELNYAAQSIA